MVKIKTSKIHRANGRARMLGELVSFDKECTTEVSEDFAALLVDTYDDMSYVGESEQVNEEVNEETLPESKEEVKDEDEDNQTDVTEESDNNVDAEKSEESSEESEAGQGESNIDAEGSSDASIGAEAYVTESMDLSELSLGNMREVAEQAGHPKEEWEGFKGPQGKKAMMEYLESKMS